MICHKCNQDSIKIHVQLDVIHISCEICGLDINCGDDNPNLCELFLYNENLEEAERLGHEAVLNSKELKDNPYSLDASQIILNKRWGLGYNREQESFELSALTLSSEKIESQLKTEIKALQAEKEAIEDKVKKFIPDNCRHIEYFCMDLMGKRFLGRILRKDVMFFLKKYKAFHRDAFGTWKHPD